MGTPTANAAPRGSVLRLHKDRQTSPEDRFDRTPTPAEMVYFLLPTPMASDGMKDGAGGGSGSTYPFRRILADPKLPTPTATQYGSQSYPDDPSRKRPSLTTLLATPRKTDADRGFRGDVLAQLQGQNNRHAGMLSTPRASDMKAGGHGDTGRMGTVRHQLQRAQETLPTPTKRDKRMDAWSPAYDKRKSPSMDAVLDGAMTNRAPDKWVYARQIAALLSEAGLTGPSQTLPITYGWMLGYPPGWLARALRSAVLAGRLPLPSSSKRSATP